MYKIRQHVLMKGGSVRQDQPRWSREPKWRLHPARLPVSIDITHIMFIGKISQMEIQYNFNTFYEKSQYTYVLLYHIMTNLKIKCQKLHFRIMISFSKYFIIETVNKYLFTILVQTD